MQLITYSTSQKPSENHVIVLVMTIEDEIIGYSAFRQL